MSHAHVKIDTRERSGDSTAFTRVNNSSRHELPFGDAWFYVDDQLQMVCERKTAEDFVKSVLSTRLVEQMRALLEFIKQNPHIPVVMVIEGDLSQVDLRGVSPRRFQTEIWNWSAVGITRMDTADINDTVEYYNYLMSRYETFGSVADYQQTLIDTVPIMSAGKKSQVTPDKFLAVTLANIGGVSANMAVTLAKEYRSLAEFVTLYNPLQAQDIVVGKKKMGPVKAKRIDAFIKNTPLAREKKKVKSK